MIRGRLRTQGAIQECHQNVHWTKKKAFTKVSTKTIKLFKSSLSTSRLRFLLSVTSGLITAGKLLMSHLKQWYCSRNCSFNILIWIHYVKWRTHKVFSVKLKLLVTWSCEGLNWDLLIQSQIMWSVNVLSISQYVSSETCNWLLMGSRCFDW